MTKTRYVVRPNPRLQKLQREYRKQQGVYKTTYLAKVNGAVRLPGGLYWVHDPAGVDAGGNTIYGAPRKMPMLAGAAILSRPNTKVDVVTVRGVDYIARTNKSELDRMGIDAHQSNTLDSAFNFKSLDWTTNLQAFKTPGASSTHIIGSIYKKPDGEYDLFPTTGGYDFVTANVPAADMQVVVCQWLNTETNDIEVTVSSEESADTDLKHPSNIATTISLINECVASAPSSHIGIWAWRIFDDTTIATLDDNNKLADLRGIVAGSDVSGDLIANTLVLRDGSELTLSANTNGVITVTKARHTVDTFNDQPTGDLKTVNGLAANEVCIITAAHTDRTVVVKNTGGTDISCATGADITLDDTVKAVALMGNIAGTGVNAYPLISDVTASSTHTFTNKTISASANTLMVGAGAAKTISAGDAVAAGADRNLVISANTGSADDLIEVSGLSIGETVLLRAASGHTISVKHNHGSATVKIHLYNNTNRNLDEQNPMRLTLVTTNVLSEDSSSSTATGDVVGPASSTDNAFARFDGTTGKLLQNSTATLGDTGVMAGASISASANTVGTGAGVSKTINGSDVLAVGTDRNIIVSANTGTADVINEITGLSVGESVYLRSATGHTIVVNHNGSGTVKTHLYNNINAELDPQNPLKLTLVDTNVLSQDLIDNVGDVFGPASSIDERVPRFDGITGKLLQGSTTSISDAGEMTVRGQHFVDGTADQIQQRVQGHSTQTANLATWEDSSGNVQVSIGPNGDTTINDEGNDADFRVESDADANNIFSDGGNNNVGFGTGTPDASAKVDIVSTTKGFGLPSMTTAQRNAISSPRDGLVVYDSDIDAVFARANGVWVRLGVHNSYAILRDEKATTTNGGASAAATWNNRNLNTETYDPDGIVSIASNQFTPIAGTYILTAVAIAFQTNQNRLRLFNVTGAASVEEGHNQSANAGDATLSTVNLVCSFTANGTDAYRIDHYTAAAKATNGLGTPVSDGSNEVYLEILLQKVA